MVETIIVRADSDGKRFVIEQTAFVTSVNVENEIADGDADANVFIRAGARENAERQILQRKIRIQLFKFGSCVSFIW
jgi:2-phosphoglycerate kinase